MINSPNLSALTEDNQNNSSNTNISTFLEVHITDENIQKFEIIEYEKTKFVISLKKDYQLLKNILEKWIDSHDTQTDQEYNYWIDAKVYNNYEGFCDSLSELKIMSNERESAIDEMTMLIDQTSFLKPEINLDHWVHKNDEQKKGISENCSDEDLNCKDERILDGTDLELEGVDDAFKKKNRKRRTRKNRKKKEEVIFENRKNNFEELEKNDWAHLDKSQFFPVYKRDEIIAIKTKFESEIEKFLKLNRNFRHGGKTYSARKIEEGIYYGGVDKYDVINGLGKIYDNPNRVIFGYFEKGLNGVGICNLLRNPNVDEDLVSGEYHGEFKNGTYDGKGGMTIMLKGIESSVSFGEWKKGLKDGEHQGRYLVDITFPDGTVYPGGTVETSYYKVNVRHGTQTMVYPNGDKYITNWSNGVMKKEDRYDVIVSGAQYNCNRTDGKGELIWKDGRKYVGEVVDKLANGLGEMIWPNGDRYTGEFVGNIQVGQGEMVYINRDIYKGDWKDNLRHGKGEMIYCVKNIYIVGGTNDYAKYIGGWEYNKKNGKGAMINTNGNKFVGDWKNDNIAQGIMFYTDGTKYIGYLDEDSKRQGMGQLIYQNGDKYIAKWYKDNVYSKEDTKQILNQDFVHQEDLCDDKMFVLTWKDGRRYEGNVGIGFILNGNGNMTLANGVQYIGQFKNNQRHGIGEMWWGQRQNYYIGPWEYNEKCGEQGKIQYGNGYKFIGDWKDRGVIEGKLEYKDDLVYEGSMQYIESNGKIELIKHGKGKYVWRNWDQYIGYWDQDKRHGKGKMVYKNGDMYDGQWNRGQRSGIGKMTWANGKRYDGEWFDDKPYLKKDDIPYLQNI